MIASELPLHAWHLAQGARMAPFAGWSMPLSYASGILAEHRHTRSGASLFDVSHMAQVLVRSRGGAQRDAAGALERLIPGDVLGLRPGRQRYGVLTTPAGGVRDDLMFANLGHAWYLVLNAATAAADIAYLTQALAPACEVEMLHGRALLAIQGPAAQSVLAPLAPAVAALRFMDVGEFSLADASCYVARSGYTGEDGFEVSVPASAALPLVERLLENPQLRPAGLGARDSLRLEAGLCLYGQDLDADTTPVEAALEWVIAPVRRTGGARAGGFPGAAIVLAQLAGGAARRRVGLRADKRPVRAGAQLFAAAGEAMAGEAAVGRITSGTFGPSLQAPVAMGYVPTALAAAGTALIADARGQRTPVSVCDLPFVPHRYHR